jgi:F-type H+-transporting ATPase subunit a
MTCAAESRAERGDHDVQEPSEARPARTRSRYRPLWIATVVILVVDVAAAVVVGFPGYPPDLGQTFEPLAPAVLFPIGPFTITNSILTTWIIGAILLVLAVALTRRLTLVPNTIQNAVEWIYESLTDFVVSLGGPEAKRYAPLFVALLLFIVLANWSGTIPVFGRVEWLRAPTSDLNVTAGLAIVSFFVFHLEGVRVLGLRRYLGKYINLRGFRHGPVDGLIELYVGILDGMLEFVKPMTLALRLFGNVYGGEVMLAVMTALFLAILPFPFLALELFIGLIQAFIFAILTLIFTVLALETHEDEHPAAAARKEAPVGSFAVAA